MFRLILLICLVFLIGYNTTHVKAQGDSGCLEPWDEWTISFQSCRILIRETGLDTNNATWLILPDKGLHQQYLYKAFASMKNRARLIFAGMPAIGRSPCRESAMPPPAIDSFLLSKLTQLSNFEQLTLVAHGLSALPALEYARHHPEQIDQLLLVSSPPLKYSQTKLRQKVKKADVGAFYDTVHTYDHKKKDHYSQLSAQLFYNKTNFSQFKFWAGIYPPLFQQAMDLLPEKWDYSDLSGLRIQIIQPEKGLYANRNKFEASKTYSVAKAGHFIWLERPNRWKNLLKKLKAGG